jgi:hypothetical protein
MRLSQERLALIAFLVILNNLHQKPQIVQHSRLGQTVKAFPVLFPDQRLASLYLEFR